MGQSSDLLKKTRTLFNHISVVCCRTLSACSNVFGWTKCSIASDVLTLNAPLLSVHVSAVLNCMTLLCPKMRCSCLNSLRKNQTFNVWCSFVTKALSSKYIYSLETINIICFQALSPASKFSATNSEWFICANCFKRLWNDSSEIFSSLKCFSFKV